MIRARAETLHHAAAHEAPAQRAHNLPKRHARWIDAAAGRLIACEQFLARAEAADRLIDFAEAPGMDADPAEILHGIAEVGELPIQNRAQPVGADNEIAVAEVAMH